MKEFLLKQSSISSLHEFLEWVHVVDFIAVMMCRSVVSIVVIVYIRPVLAGLKRPDQDKKACKS